MWMLEDQEFDGKSFLPCSSSIMVVNGQQWQNMQLLRIAGKCPTAKLISTVRPHIVRTSDFLQDTVAALIGLLIGYSALICSTLAPAVTQTLSNFISVAFVQT